MPDQDITPQNDIDGDVVQQETPPAGDQPTPDAQPAQPAPKADAPLQRPESLLGGQEQKPGEPLTPESYGEFAVPEGMEVDGDLMGQFTKLAAAEGMPKESAQKLLDLHTDILLKQQAGYVRQLHDWRQELQSDPHYGGEKLQATCKDALRALEKFDRFGLREDLIANGYENNPKVIKMLAEIGRHFKDDKIVTGREKPPAAPQSLRDALWPDDVMPKY
jgi:hypothetical protein